jgi:hypothetical protein
MIRRTRTVVVAARCRLPLICLAAFCAAAQGTAASAADLSSLHIKSGLWELSQSTVGKKGENLGRICVDASVEHIMIELLTGSRKYESCTKFDVQLSGHRVTVDTQCPGNSWTVFSHQVTIFEGDRAAHFKGRTQYLPPVFGMSTVLNSADGKWVGACPDDMKPGDDIVWNSLAPQNLRRFNLLDAPPPTVIRGTRIGP